MSTKNQVFQLRLDDETRRKLKEIAKLCDANESEVIRALIIDFYDSVHKD